MVATTAGDQAMTVEHHSSVSWPCCRTAVVGLRWQVPGWVRRYAAGRRARPFQQVNLDGERQVMPCVCSSGVPGIRSGRPAGRPATARRPTIRCGRGRCAGGGSGPRRWDGVASTRGRCAEFLDRVASDLAAVYDALAQSRRETDRIKDALRRWQSEQTRARNERSHGR